jgi:ribosomal protein S18 acetylase RimI-like enzyme
VTIRHAQPCDRGSIAAVQAESWRDAYAGLLPKEYLTGRLAQDLERHWSRVDIQPGDVVLVAEEDRVVGFVAVWCRPEPFVDNLHVKPAQRSRGVGSALMRAAARELIRQNQSSASLWVLESNRRALRFYERLGGVCSGRATKNLFGHELESLRVVWSDLTLIVEG